MKNKISEGFTQEGSPDLKYYAFDWDDNVMNMPTQIMVVDNEGNELGISTEDFAEHRHQLGKEPFVYNGKTVVGYASNPFRNFRVAGDAQFLKDVEEIKSRQLAPSWDDFVECINTASIFAIITARGHDPETLKEAVKYLIKNNKYSIDKTAVFDSIKKYRKLFGKRPIENEDEVIEKYLSLCKFYPVSFGPAASMSSPEQAKVAALEEFVDYCKNLNQRMPIKVGFSDDDRKNFKTIDEVVKELDNETYSNVKEFYIKYTGEGDAEKNIYTKYTESKIKNFKDFVFETSNQAAGMESSVLSATDLGNMTNRLNQTDLNIQDSFQDWLIKQTRFLAKNSKNLKKEIKRNYY